MLSVGKWGNRMIVLNKVAPPIVKKIGSFRTKNKFIPGLAIFSFSVCPVGAVIHQQHSNLRLKNNSRLLITKYRLRNLISL